MNDEKELKEVKEYKVYILGHVQARYSCSDKTEFEELVDKIKEIKEKEAYKINSLHIEYDSQVTYEYTISFSVSCEKKNLQLLKIDLRYMSDTKGFNIIITHNDRVVMMSQDQKGL